MQPCGTFFSPSFSFLFLHTCITHSVLGGGGFGHAPQENFLNLDHIKLLLKPSETIITTQNLWQRDCNSGNSLYGCFSEPESAFVYEPLP